MPFLGYHICSHTISISYSSLVMLLLITSQCIVWFLHYLIIDFPFETNKQSVGRQFEVCKHSALHRANSSPTHCLYIHPLTILAQARIYCNGDKMMIHLQHFFCIYQLSFYSKKEYILSSIFPSLLWAYRFLSLMVLLSLFTWIIKISYIAQAAFHIIYLCPHCFCFSWELP